MVDKRIKRDKYSARPDRDMIPDAVSMQTSFLGRLFATFIGDVPSEGLGPNISFAVVRQGQAGGFSLDLTAWTEEELNAFEQVINHAMTLARPIIQARDRRANDGEQSHSAFARLYRGLPKVFERSWPFALDRESLLCRPVNVPDEDSD